MPYVFVPDSYFDFNKEAGGDPATVDFSTFDEETYRISRWQKLNALANNLDENLPLLPDLDNLLPNEEENFPRLKTRNGTAVCVHLKAAMILRSDGERSAGLKK